MPVYIIFIMSRRYSLRTWGQQGNRVSRFKIWNSLIRIWKAMFIVRNQHYSFEASIMIDLKQNFFFWSNHYQFEVNIIILISAMELTTTQTSSTSALATSKTSLIFSATYKNWRKCDTFCQLLAFSWLELTHVSLLRNLQLNLIATQTLALLKNASK